MLLLINFTDIMMIEQFNQFLDYVSLDPIST